MDKGLEDRADTWLVRSDEADRVDEALIWPDEAFGVDDETADDGLESLLEDARAAAKTGAAWFAEEFRRRDAEELRSPTFPAHKVPAPVDAEVEAQAIDAVD
ncbi:MAG TPA: hypothetical protein VJ736_08300 [Actinomycetota bacterium]|nr:hypothetical protein [Actinomycetota bacterium]